MKLAEISIQFAVYFLFSTHSEKKKKIDVFFAFLFHFQFDEKAAMLVWMFVLLFAGDFSTDWTKLQFVRSLKFQTKWRLVLSALWLITFNLFAIESEYNKKPSIA